MLRVIPFRVTGFSTKEDFAYPCKWLTPESEYRNNEQRVFFRHKNGPHGCTGHHIPAYLVASKRWLSFLVDQLPLLELLRPLEDLELRLLLEPELLLAEPELLEELRLAEPDELRLGVERVDGRALDDGRLLVPELREDLVELPVERLLVPLERVLRVVPLLLRVEPLERVLRELEPLERVLRELEPLERVDRVLDPLERVLRLVPLLLRVLDPLERVLRLVPLLLRVLDPLERVERELVPLPLRVRVDEPLLLLVLDPLERVERVLEPLRVLPRVADPLDLVVRVVRVVPLDPERVDVPRVTVRLVPLVVVRVDVPEVPRTVRVEPARVPDRPTVRLVRASSSTERVVPRPTVRRPLATPRPEAAAVLVRREFEARYPPRPVVLPRGPYVLPE